MADPNDGFNGFFERATNNVWVGGIFLGICVLCQLCALMQFCCSEDAEGTADVNQLVQDQQEDFDLLAHRTESAERLARDGTQQLHDAAKSQLRLALG